MSRLEQCRDLAELLKRFQHLRSELSGTLQRAESAVEDQASYVGKENLFRLQEKVEHRIKIATRVRLMLTGSGYLTLTFKLVWVSVPVRCRRLKQN